MSDSNDNIEIYFGDSYNEDSHEEYYYDSYDSDKETFDGKLKMEKIEDFNLFLEK